MDTLRCILATAQTLKLCPAVCGTKDGFKEGISEEMYACIMYCIVRHMSQHPHNTVLRDTARVSVVGLMRAGQLIRCLPSTASDPDRSYLPAVTLTPDFRQLSVVPLNEEETCGILALLPKVAQCQTLCRLYGF